MSTNVDFEPLWTALADRAEEQAILRKFVRQGPREHIMKHLKSWTTGTALAKLVGLSPNATGLRLMRLYRRGVVERRKLAIEWHGCRYEYRLRIIESGIETTGGWV